MSIVSASKSFISESSASTEREVLRIALLNYLLLASVENRSLISLIYLHDLDLEFSSIRSIKPISSLY